MKIKKSKLQEVIYETIDNVIGEEEDACNHAALEGTPEYEGALRFLDPNLVYFPTVCRKNPELWQLFGKAWEIVLNKIQEPQDVHYLIGMPRDDHYEYLGFSPEEKEIVMKAYHAGQAINRKKPLPKGLTYGLD
jgi:hypothetical protein|tara:strand:+ start:1614 stop:2015 length:402 start_codon:yes stop_codon:yes gene_type:complete